MVFLTRSFGRWTVKAQQPEMALLCLYKTISLALLRVTIINANDQRPCLHSEATMAAPCVLLALMLFPCLYKIVQPIATSSKAVSDLSWWQQNRSLSTWANFLQELWTAGFTWGDCLSGISLHFVREALQFLFDSYCALVKSCLG